MYKLWMDLRGERDPLIRRNFLANVIDGSFFTFGMSVVSVQTVLPVLVLALGGSNIAVGLVPVIWTFGSNFPQILVARWSQRIPYKKRIMVQLAFIQRLAWLAMAMFCLFLADAMSPEWRVGMILLLLLASAVGISVNAPIWFDVVTKVTPLRLRGRMFGMRSVIGSLLGVLGGSIVAAVLQSAPFPRNFGYLFIIAFAVLMISLGGLAAVRERRPSPVRNMRSGSALRRVRHVLATDHNFRNFIVADALVMGSTMASAFFAVHAIQKFNLPEAFAGIFTAVMMGSAIVGSFILGYVADRAGHRWNLIASAGSMIGGAVIALTADSVEFYLISFALLAINISVNVISRYPIVAEFCDESERATYIAITNTVTAPFVLLGVAAGWVADEVGYTPVFVSAGCFAFTGLVILLRKVKEPRHLPPFSVPEQG